MLCDVFFFLRKIKYVFLTLSVVFHNSRVGSDLTPLDHGFNHLQHEQSKHEAINKIKFVHVDYDNTTANTRDVNLNFLCPRIE